MKTLGRTISKALSFLLFPLFIPLYGIVLLLNMKIFSFYPQYAVCSIYIATFVFGVVIPILTYVLMHRFRIISNVKMYKKEDRILPYIFTAVYYLYCAWFFYQLSMPMFATNIAIATALATLVCAIVSKWWQISAHLTGMGALVAGVIFVQYKFGVSHVALLCGVFLASGTLASARLCLKRHNPAQLIAGFLNGFLCVMLIAPSRASQIFALLN